MLGQWRERARLSRRVHRVLNAAPGDQFGRVGQHVYLRTFKVDKPEQGAPHWVTIVRGPEGWVATAARWLTSETLGSRVQDVRHDGRAVVVTWAPDEEGDGPLD